MSVNFLSSDIAASEIGVIRNIRPATEKDIPQLLELGAQFHAESSYRTISLNIEKLEKFYRHQINHEDALLLVSERDQKLQGYFTASIQEYFFSTEKLAFDLSHYVLPAFRGSPIIIRFIKIYQDWCALKGASEATVSVSTGINPDKASRLYSRLGFELSGFIHKTHLHKESL
jgi:GNAT superfamily N-acetyltransferase